MLFKPKNSVRIISCTLLYLLLTTACVPTPGLTPTLATPMPIAEGKGDSPAPTRAAVVTASPASPCPSLSTNPQAVTPFSPTQSKGALAFTADGISIIDPSNQQITVIHSLHALGLNGWDRYPSWSPDGTRLAFLYTQAGPEDCARGYVMLADFQSGEVRRLTEGTELYGRPVWAQDSLHLALIEARGRLDILDVNSRKITTLAQDAVAGVAPVWQNTGVVYLRRAQDDQTTDLISQALDGTPPRVLLPNLYGAPVLTLSPDGKRAAVYRGYFAIVDLSSGREQNLGENPSERLQWSPDARRVLGRGGLAGLFLVQPDLAWEVIQVNVLGVPGAAQSWSPDSHRFAVLLGADGQAGATIGIYDLNERALRELSAEVQPPYDVAWSPK